MWNYNVPDVYRVSEVKKKWNIFLKSTVPTCQNTIPKPHLRFKFAGKSLQKMGNAYDILRHLWCFQ